MVQGGLCILGLLLGSWSALPLNWWGGGNLSVCQLADIAFCIFCVCALTLFQDGVLSGTESAGHRQGAEVVPWLGREFVPLWPFQKQV